MEKIVNHQVGQFFQMKNLETVESYLLILECLQPSFSIANPKFRWWKKEPKTLRLREIKSLTFGEVTSIRNDFKSGNPEAIFSAIRTLTKLNDKEILEVRIIDFYSMISTIKQQLTEISNMEMNNLVADDSEFNFEAEAVNASQRMAKFGELTTIDFLANKDITKWKEIQDLPYMTVFAKLMINKEETAIQKEIANLQKKKNN